MKNKKKIVKKKSTGFQYPKIRKRTSKKKKRKESIFDW